MPYANDGGSSWNATKCVPIMPNPDGVGEPCTAEESGVSGIDSCEAQAMCWDVDPQTLEGVCIAFCEGTAEQPSCAPGSSCAISGDGILVICLPWCDPLAQDCYGDELCLPHKGEFTCVHDASGDLGAYGDPCEYANSCDPGLYCALSEHVPGCGAVGCCTPYCDTSMANTCPGDGQECIPWFGGLEEGEAPPGFENVGACGIPG
jgi:hypothetical protein